MPKYHYMAVDKYGKVAVIQEPGTGASKGTFSATEIQIMDDEGNVMIDTSLKDGSATPQEVSKVRGIAYGPDGHLYVAAILIGGTTTNQAGDTGIILKYDDEINCMNDLGWDVGDYFHTSNIEGLSVDDRGFIYVGSSGDTTTRCCLVLDDEGNVIRDFGTSV